MRPLLLLLFLLTLTAAAEPIRVGPVQSCEDATLRHCARTALTDVHPDTAETLVAREVVVSPNALPLARPLMVMVTAMASSELRWNGVLIGRNGRPGPDRDSEQPGRFVAFFTVPDALVRPGVNTVALRMSAHHLWLPVRRPVHIFGIGPYETPSLPGLSDYLPALLSLGALIGALIYFGAAARSGERDARLLAMIAGSASLQLVAEVARAFIAYTYPWHVGRVAAIALLAGITALLTIVYVTRRFAPGWRKPAITGSAFLILFELLFIPWYDLKAMAAILIAASLLVACGIHGQRRRVRGAAGALAGGVLLIALMAWQRTAFLDQSYYVVVAGLFVALVAEQVATLRLERRARGAEAARAEALEARLRRASEAGEPIVQLKDGTRHHRVPAADLLFIKAADDYCDASLADGRTLLVTMNLAQTLETLPADFVRVHKSYAVNRRHIASVAPRPGGGKLLRLTGGATVPVGRAYGSIAVGLDGAGSAGNRPGTSLRPSPSGG